MAYIKQRRHQEPGHDLLQTLMDARYSDGEGMSDELVLSESMQLLVAGHETSSNALSWMFYLLSSHPDCLEKMRQEFDSVLGDAPLSYNDVPRFEFTAQVIQEALRLYPPFWMIDRNGCCGRPRRGCRHTPRIDGDCVRVRRAPCAQVLAERRRISTPSDFTKENEKLQPPFTYLPFGGGPRGCIGGNFAMLQILMILSVLLQEIRFSTGSGPDDRGAPDGHPAPQTRNPHELHRGNRTRPSRDRPGIRSFPEIPQFAADRFPLPLFLNSAVPACLLVQHGNHE